MALWRRPKNILRGIVPVASGWDTAPTNLAACTDSDINTVTGTGSTVKGGAGDYGFTKFDLGAVKTVLVGGKIGTWSSSNTVLVYLESSTDGNTWIGGTAAQAQSASVSEVLSEIMSKIVTGRYIRLHFYLSGGGATCYAKIYSVMAYELTL